MKHKMFSLDLNDLLMKNRRKILPFFILLIVSSVCYSQKTSTGKLPLNKIRENITLQTDRELYITGETVFYTIKYFINNSLSELQISNVIYVELLNSDNETVLNQKIKLKKGKAAGKFSIPKYAATGNYLIRAYTQYQRNFDLPGFTYNQIVIINPDIPVPSTKREHQRLVEIIPEGGTLLEGVKNNVSLLLRDSVNRLTQTLQLIDQKEKVVKEYQRKKNGLYLLKITPSDTLEYKLRLIDIYKDTTLKDFPAQEKFGMITSVRNQGEELFYSMKRNAKKMSSKTYKLEIYSNDFRKIEETSIKLIGEKTKMKFNQDKLGKGLLYFVLKDANNRIVRINSSYSTDYINEALNLTTLKDTFKTREKVELTITQDRSDMDVIQSSVSVIRKGTSMLYGSNIPAHVFLSPSLLNQSIMKRAYSNSFNHEELRAGLYLYDHRINTQEFYTKLEHLSGTELNYVPDIRDISLKGVLMNSEKNEPVPGKKVIASVLFNNPQIHICKTNSKGEFIFSLNNISGKNDVFLCPYFYNPGEEKLKIFIKDLFSTEMPDFERDMVPVDESMKALLEEMIVNHQLTNRMRDEGKRKQDSASKKVMSPFYIKNMATVEMSDYVEFESMEKVFENIVPNVYVKKKNGRYRFEITENKNYFLPRQPLILVDNIPVFDVNKVMNIHPSLVEKIDIIYKPYILGDNTFYGVIMITSKGKNFADIKFPERSTFLQYQGASDGKDIIENFTEQEEPPKQHEKPYFRTTLYWNPNLIIPAEGRSVSFYTSDRKGSYDILVRGFTKDGEYYYKKKTIFVR